MKFLVVNSKENYAGKLKILTEECAKKKLALDLWDKDEKTGVVNYAKEAGYAAIIHRNEHGRLFADGSYSWVKESVTSGFPVISVDFGYLDHYKTFMFDYYRNPDLSSGIHDEWDKIPDKIEWKKTPRYIKNFRSEIFEKIAKADNSQYAGKVGVWMQWNANLLRPELGGLKQWEWINKVCQKIVDVGFEPIVKMNLVDHSEIYKQTIPYVAPWIKLICDKPKVAESNQRAWYDKNANWKMLAGCSYHIIMCSSVSHSMVLAQKPVIATGQSWFNALNVFAEPVEWNSPFVKPSINHSARNKWINWWLSRQCKFEDSAETLLRVFNLATKHFNK